MDSNRILFHLASGIWHLASKFSLDSVLSVKQAFQQKLIERSALSLKDISNCLFMRNSFPVCGFTDQNIICIRQKHHLRCDWNLFSLLTIRVSISIISFMMPESVFDLPLYFLRIHPFYDLSVANKTDLTDSHVPHVFQTNRHR